MSGDLCSQTEAAQLLGVGRDLIRRWVKAGILPCFTDPETGRPVYSRVALRAWQDAQGRIAAEKGAA